MTQLSPANLDKAFSILEACAVAGERCPVRDHGGLSGMAIRALAHEGRIFIEISSKNWRRVTIMTGPNKGKSTAQNPYPKARVYQTIGKEGRKINGKFVDSGSGTPNRNQPSAPRFLTAEELSR